ncbi:kinesin light chain-like protein [Candidatus Scalindua japonica]|uniref:Kinesin light chain-like protein n=1 Tax=Candidatus Scalindua japonica TaxID=1284222 RepID=A0A286TU12_9BACT|nr:hypothetical protein [Candidatus Scalindua japonica]GAX59345.1 kinesin light chain-like protein [Candidatus Scalindua japonica]
MDEKKESKSSLPLPALLLISVFIAGGVVKYIAPMDSMRPSHNRRNVETQFGDERVLSRMWQDPLQTVDQYIKRQKKEERIAVNNPQPLGFKESPLLILPVFTGSGNSAEDSEVRLRSRYALLSALHTAGYKSKNASHIGAFNLKEFRELYLREKYKDDWSRYDQDAFIPFEWFVPDPFMVTSFVGKQNKKLTEYKSILVIWLSERYFNDEIICQLKYLHDYLFNLFKCKEDDELCFKIIGPTNSTLLEKMLSEAEKGSLFMTSCDISNWKHLLKFIKNDKKVLRRELLISKLNYYPYEKIKNIDDVNQLDDKMKNNILDAFNEIKDDLSFYKNNKDEIDNTSIMHKSSIQDKFKKLKADKILDKSGKLLIEKDDLTNPQKWDIERFNVAILKQLYEQKGKTMHMYSPWSTAEPFFMSNSDFREKKVGGSQEIVEIMRDPSLILEGNIDWESLLDKIKKGSNKIENNTLNRGMKILESKLNADQLENIKKKKIQTN